MIESEEGTRLFIESGSSLSIFNEFRVLGPAGKMLSAILHRQVEEIHQQQESVTLIVEDGSSLRVDLRDAAYKGPEAMELTSAEGAIIVWN